MLLASDFSIKTEALVLTGSTFVGELSGELKAKDASASTTPCALRTRRQ